METNRIKERLLKMYALATEGVDGERDAAQRLLDENLKKYGLNITDLIGSDSEVNEIYWFAVKDKYQRRLLEQLYGVFIVKDNQYSVYSHKALRYNVGLKMTKSQNVELTLMYDFYLTQWKKEIEKIIKAKLGPVEAYLVINGKFWEHDYTTPYKRTLKDGFKALVFRMKTNWVLEIRNQYGNFVCSDIVHNGEEIEKMLEKYS